MKIGHFKPTIIQKYLTALSNKIKTSKMTSNSYHVTGLTISSLLLTESSYDDLIDSNKDIVRYFFRETIERFADIDVQNLNFSPYVIYKDIVMIEKNTKLIEEFGLEKEVLGIKERIGKYFEEFRKEHPVKKKY